MALVTQTNLENHLQTTIPAGKVAAVTEYLLQAQAAVEAYCRQPLEWASGISETFEVDQPEAWWNLSRFPVTGVTSVTEDTTLLTVTTDYRWYNDGRLWRVSGGYDGQWSTWPGGVVVVYDAGYGVGAPAPYDAIPADLSLAIVIYTAELYRHGEAYAEHGAVPVSSVTLEGSDSIDFAEPDTATPGEQPLLGARSKQLLGPYMRRTM